MPPKELVDEIEKAYNEYKKEKEKEVDYLTFYCGFVACNRNRQQENNKLLDVINNQDVKIADLGKKLEKMKQDLDNARESANRQEQWEISSVLNDLYNDNFEVITSVSN